MRGPLLALSFVSLSLAWLVFFGAGVRPTDWNAALLFLGATALFYWTFRSGQTPPHLPTWHAVALWALPGYAFFQLLPLPPPILESLSPARQMLTETVGGVIPNLTHAPLSLAPGAATSGLFSLLGCLTVFSLIRDIKWRFVERRPWLTVAPLGVIAALEAFIGVGQWLSGPANTPVRGTLSSGEQFISLLEIALPLTLVYGFICFRRHQTQTTPSAMPAAHAATSWLAALLILLALFHSNPQGSRVVVSGSLLVLLSLALVPRLKTKKLRWYGAGAAAAFAIVALLVTAPPADFVESLAQIGATEKTPAETRLAVWSNSAVLLSEFRWFGTGIGGFEPAFLKYQGSSDLSSVSNPRNDAVALFAAWGIVGGLIALLAVAGVFRPAIMGALFLLDEPRRLLAATVIASLTAALLRGGIGSFFCAPFLAMSFAWLAGVSQSCGLE